MALTELTKITGPGIATDTNWVGNNANYTGILTASSLGGIGNLNVTGIITASSFSGDGSGLIGVASTDNIVTGTAATFNTYPVDINAGMTVAGVVTFAGNVSIAGTLTYEDVTNIDSVGIITGKGADINGDLDVDGHTNLDNVSVAGVTTFNNNVHFKLNDKLYFGNNNELEIYQQGNNTFIFNNDDAFSIGQVGQGAAHTMKIYGGTEFELKHYTTNGGQTSVFKSIRGGAFTLYHAGSNTPSADQIRLETTSTGLNFPRDIDVDGHTELDNVNISGVVTATTFIGDGSNLTGVSGFATALSNDQSSPLNVFFKTPKQVNVSTGESIVVQSDATSGNIAFCRESIIHVSTGATMRVATGTQLRMNVLDLF